MANETVIHSSIFVRGAQDPNIPAERFAVFTGTGTTDLNLLGYRTASGIVSDLGLPEIIDDEVATLLSGGTNISINYNDAANKLVISSTAGLSGSGTANQVAYWTSTGVTGENDFWWNPSSNFLGIGTNSPSNSLHIEGSSDIISYVRTTSASNYSAVQLQNDGTNIASLSSYGSTYTGTLFGISYNNLSVLNATNNLAINSQSGNIIAGINGTQIFRVTSTGLLVGTGSTANRTLEVSGNMRIGTAAGTSYSQLLGRNSGNGDVGFISLGDGLSFSGTTLSVTGSVIGSGTANQVAYWTSSGITGENDLWWNPTSNFLGIGTNSPSNHLQINATSPSTSLIGTTITGTTSISLTNNTSDTGQLVLYGGSNPMSLYGISFASATILRSSSNLFLNIGGSLLVGNNSTEFFRATSSGVGIGGVVPTRTLHVAGTMRLTGSTGTATNIMGRDDNGDVSNLLLGAGLSISSGTLSATGATGTGTTNQVTFWGNTTTLSGDTLFIWNPSNKRLGIGNSNPQQTVDIGGTLRVSGSTGTGTTLMARNSSGDVSAVVVDGGLQLLGNVISVTGVTFGTGTTNYVTKWSSATGLTNSIIFDNGTAIGVNTNAPQQTLDVRGTMRLTGSTGTGTTLMGRDNNGDVSAITTGNGLSLSGNTLTVTGRTAGSGAANQIAYWATASSLTGENDLWWNPSSNFLGIGTNTPISEIDIRGNAPQIYVNSTGSTTASNLLLTNNTFSGVRLMVYGGSDTSTLYGMNLADSTLLASTKDLFLRATDNLYVGNLTTEFFRATSSGVGIGGVVPTRTLHVAGTMRLTGSTGTATNIMGRDGNGDVSAISVGSGLSLSGNILTATGGTSGTVSGTGTTNYVTKWASATGLTNSIIFDNGTSVGINTTTPVRTLHVAGTMRLTGSTGTGTTLMARDANFDVSAITVGNGLSLSNNILTTTGVTSGTVSGTGTTNYIPKWSSASGLTDSIIIQTGSNVDIRGTLKVTGSTGTPSFVLGRDSDGNVANLSIGSGLGITNGQLFATGGASGTTSGSGSTNQVAYWTGTNSIAGENNLWWDSGANRLGIGTSTPQQTLHVAGNMRLTGSNGTATTLMGRDGNDDISAVSIGSGLNLSGNTLIAAGITDGDKGDITVSGGGTIWTIDNNVVSDSKLRTSSGLSVIGRASNTTGNVADITASVDGTVLRRSGTTLSFGTVGTDGIADSAITNIKVANGIDAAKIADGSVDNTEFQYLNGVTSNIQNQLNAKVAGTGTTNYVSKWASASGLTDSIIFDNGTVVGINTTTPLQTLDVRGTMRLTGSTGTGTTLMARDNSGDVSAITVGNGLSLSNNILTTTGITAGTVSGTGTTNYIPKWSSASGLTDSIIIQTGSNVDIRGTLRVTGSTGTPSFVLGRDSDGNVANLSIGSGLGITNGQLFATGGATGTTSGTGSTNQVAYWTGTNSIAGENNLWWDNGTDRLGVGTNNPQQTLHVAGNMRLTGSNGTADSLMGRDGNFDVSAITVGVGLSLSGNTLTATGTSGGGGTLTGTGTTNYISKWASASGLTDSIIFHTGSTVGINTTSPTALLYLKGTTANNSATAFEVTDSNDRDILNIRNDGRITLGKNLAATTQNTVSFEAVGSDEHINFAVQPKGDGAFLGNIPDATATGGNSRGSFAIDLQLKRSNNTEVASGNYSVIIGGSNNTASGTRSNIVGGSSNTASGTHSSVFGGLGNVVSAEYASVIGGLYGSAYLYGQNTNSSGNFSYGGDAQSSTIRMRNSITGTTRTELYLDGVSAKAILSGTNRLWNIRIQLAAVVEIVGTGGGASIGDSFISEHILGIKKIGTVTTIVGEGVAQNIISNDTAMSSATVSISADNATDNLKIEFTPPSTAVSDTVIKVIATVYLTEVGFGI